jgi:hypothetical protein
MKDIYRFCLAIFVFVTLCFLATESRLAGADRAAANEGKETGLQEGETAPPFHALDQSGKEQTEQSVAGKNGTVLLFFRSADW